MRLPSTGPNGVNASLYGLEAGTIWIQVAAESALDALQGGVDLEHLAQRIQAFHVATVTDVIVSKTVQQERQTVMGP